TLGRDRMPSGCRHRIEAKPELFLIAPALLRGGYAPERHDVAFAGCDLDGKMAAVFREIVGDVLLRNRYVLRCGLLLGREIDDLERALRLGRERPIPIFEGARRLAGVAQEHEKVDVVLVRAARCSDESRVEVRGVRLPWGGRLRLGDGVLDDLE